MVRTTVGTIAEAQLSVQRTESVTQIQASQTSTISPGDTQQTVITAPSGTVLEVLTLRVVITGPGGASTGDHGIIIFGPNSRNIFLQATANGSNNVRVNHGFIRQADDKQRPSTEIAQQNQIRSLLADDTNGIIISYGNRTDVDQTNTRNIDIVALERGVSN